jgi:hypothetical protein
VSLLMITCSMKLLVETVNSDHTRLSLSHRNCDYLCFVCICTKHTCGLAAVGLCVCGECVWGYAYMLHVNGMCEKNLFAVMQLIFF